MQEIETLSRVKGFLKGVILKEDLLIHQTKTWGFSKYYYFVILMIIFICLIIDNKCIRISLRKPLLLVRMSLQDTEISSLINKKKKRMIF